MEDLNITMEEYIRLEEEKARRHSIVFDDTFTCQAALSCEPMVSPLNDNEIDFRISFNESDDEDYTVIIDKNSFSYKIIYVDDLKTDLENDNDKVNMPLFLSPEPMVSYFNDLDYLKDFENEYPAIVYNDALTFKLDFLIEPSINPQRINEFNLKDETLLSKYDGEEQNVLYFNDLFPFNIIYPNELKLDEDNDDKKINAEKPWADVSAIPLPNEINTDVGSYAQGSNKLLKINMAHPPRDQRHQYLKFECLEYTDADIIDFEDRMGMIYYRGIHRVLVLDFESLSAMMVEGLTIRMFMKHRDAQGQIVFTNCAWRQCFEVEAIIDIDDKAEEMEIVGFGLCWAKSARQISNKGDLSAYWRGISSKGDIFGAPLSYTHIRDPMMRLCHRLIVCNIARRSQAHEKVTVTDLFYLRGMGVGLVNIPYLLARGGKRLSRGRKAGWRLWGEYHERWNSLSIFRSGPTDILGLFLMVALIEVPSLNVAMRMLRLFLAPYRHLLALTTASRHRAGIWAMTKRRDTWINNVIMEYLVKISKKARILELKRRHLKIIVLTSYTPYPSRKIRRILTMTKVIKEEFEKLGLLEIDEDFFTYDTQLGMIFNEFNRLSGIHDDLFTYEIENPTPCVEQTSDAKNNNLESYEWKMSYEECEKIYAEAVILIDKRLVRLIDVIVEQWLDLKSYKRQFEEYLEIKRQRETYTREVDMEYNPSNLMRGDDEVILSDKEVLDLKDKNNNDKHKIAKIFRIETNLFDYETPLYTEFKELNYLLKVDAELFTHNIKRTKTYEDYKNELNDEIGEPWSEDGVPYEICDHICEPFRFKNRKAKWPTCSSNDDGFCNGGELPGMVRLGYMTYLQDYEWYNELTDGNLKKEALKRKAIYEKSWGNASQSVIKFCAWLKRSFGNFHELDYELLVKLQDYWWKVKDQECSPFANWRDYIQGPYANFIATHDPYLDVNRIFGRNVCKIRRFGMIKYSFGQDEEYVVVKECEYDDLTKTNEDACRTYQDIFCSMDEGWVVTRAE
ncbi:hypothetical protein Tco_0666665 [Tanacetum coccineum]